MNEVYVEEVDAGVAWAPARVAEAMRFACLPRHFGKHCARVESAIFTTLSRLCAGYHGGYWEFYTLPNGGFYMAPDVDGELRLVCDGNGFDGALSADAAGIVVCLMALSHLSFVIDDPRIAQGFHKLYAAMFGHPESAVILRAID